MKIYSPHMGWKKYFVIQNNFYCFFRVSSKLTRCNQSGIFTKHVTAWTSLSSVSPRERQVILRFYSIRCELDIGKDSYSIRCELDISKDSYSIRCELDISKDSYSIRCEFDISKDSYSARIGPYIYFWVIADFSVEI